MSERILMQVSGAVRPLRLGQTGPIMASAELPQWSGIPVEIQALEDWDGDAEVGPLHGRTGLMVFLSGSVEFLARGRERDHTWLGRKGDATLISGQEPPRLLRCRGQAQVAALDLSTSWIWATAGVKPTQLSATPPLGIQRSIANKVGTLVRLVQQRTSDPLPIETASFDIVSELLDALPGQHPSRSSSKLSQAECRRIQNYVRQHLGTSITHGELAKLTALGPRQFSTVFKATFATTPYQYVLSMRLREAARLMRVAQRDLADIAYEVGFSSQSHFSTAWKQAFGVRPRDYARGWRTSIAMPHP